ncbi:ATP-binding protein [Sphingobacterium oryzagri]|uniref:histidine kinase n=1 Tax=Sphingobacterium oryzagri TaxID=3025669 RepID=A0ABY7WMJ5_9SPHI|nr:ATP-binding protein [Sphingobacterium sp. KACC 22765]WDF70804.1 ATP-binding protein [Sphingobacterium sp. KACC 22765]
MNALKGKIFFILLLSALCIGGIGYYSITNLFELTSRIEQLSSPNKKWTLFREITADLHQLNGSFLSQGLSHSQSLDNMQVGLIDSIRDDIVKLRSTYGKEISPAELQQLDTIPKVLERIKAEFQGIKVAQQQKQQEVYDGLEQELLAKMDNFSRKDSLNIVKKISMEVRNRNIPDSVFFYTEQSGKEKQSFLRRLFSKAKPVESTTKVVRSYKTVTDTILHTSSDTIVAPSSTEELLDDSQLSGVIKQAFSNYYNNELELLEKVKENEIKLYQKSARITADVEQFINELRFKDTQQSMQHAKRILVFSERFQHIILWVIGFFAILSLLLVYLVSKDINKNKKYQLQILDNEEKARREAVAKQEFLTTMSHELRTPLTSIIGYAELLDEDDPKSQSIKSSSRHLLNVANEILDTAKIESGIIEVKVEPVDLTDLLQQVRDNTVQMIVDAGFEPRFELPQEPIYVSTDAYRMQQVLYNLIHNALKFTFAGFVGLKASIIEKGDQYEVNLTVIDSGIGIQAANTDRIFENYQQIGTYKNKAQGIGLGLGLVRKIVQQLGGNISVKSKIGEGSAFTVFLPLERSDKRVIRKSTESISKQLFRGKTICCLDDDPLINKLYKMILTDYGADVVLLGDPHAAVTHLQSSSAEKYDLVITDIKMPGMTGYELLLTLEESGHRPKKMVASTANVLLEQKDREDLAKFDAYISKPVLKEKLLKTLADVLEIPLVIDGEEVEKKPVEEQLFDMKELAMFTMGDETMLHELLVEMHVGNDELLKQGMTYLAENKPVALGELIHKLSSRFAQMHVKEVTPVKPLETLLLDAGDGFKEAELLLNHWSEVNHQLQLFIEQKFDS